MKQDSIKKLIGKKIRLCRLTKGYFRLKLGIDVGVSEGQILKYESGQDHVSASTLFKISESLKVPIFSFFDSLEVNSREATESDNLVSLDEGAVFAAFKRIESLEVRSHVARLILTLATQDGASMESSEA